MNRINITSVDLNLLVVFDAVMRERNVSRAAAKLHLTQPAVSHALGRLRATLNDPLFVRTTKGMEPTAVSRRIGGQVALVLSEIDQILASPEPFDSARSSRRFAIGMTDYTAFVFLPRLARRLEAKAPGIELVVRATDRTTSTDMIESGNVEIVIGGMSEPSRSYISSMPLTEERSMCAARRNHPAFRGKALSQARYLGAIHLHVSPWGELGHVDEMLRRQGATRRIGMTIGQFLLAPAILETTDLIATLPERVLRPLAKRFEIALKSPPFDLGSTPILMYWHKRLDDDAGLSWLRGQIADVAREL